MSKYAILNGAGQVINTVEWDGNTATWQPPAGTTVQMWTSSMPVAAKSVTEQNLATLQQNALTALSNNAAFINSTAVQRTANADAQILALTRQSNGVIRLLLNQLDATT